MDKQGSSDHQSKKRKFLLGDERGTSDRPVSNLESLPRDLALDVLSRLPVTSLIRVGFVSQAWRELSRDPLLARQHLSKASKSDPCLIFHSDYPIRNRISFVRLSEDDDERTVRKLRTPFCNSMPEFNVIGSCNGLLCLADSLYNDPFFVFNPFTRRWVELPKSRQFQEQEMVFGFGFHRITNEYKVVKVVYYRNPCNGPRQGRGFRIREYNQSDVQVLTVGKSSSWRSNGKAPYQLDWRHMESAVVNGRVHWVSRLGRHRGVRGRLIVSFDLEDEQFREILRPDCGRLNRSTYQLVELNGCLSAAVFHGYGKLEIWVMKEYEVRESWTKQFCVGAYSPKLLLRPDLAQSYGIWRKALTRRVVRILCMLNSGEILLEYKGRSLASYNPATGKFTGFEFSGMPDLFHTVIHVGSLSWIDNTPI